MFRFPVKMQGPPFNDLTYYTYGTPDGSKPAIHLEELGLKYKCVTINITKGEQKDPAYLKINPNGKIPALCDGDLQIFESGAIMLYLAEYYDTDRSFTYNKSEPAYWEMVAWLMFQIGGVGPMHGQGYHFCAMAPVRSAHAIERFLDEVKRQYQVLESKLADSPWLAGDKYTIADMANFTWVRTGPGLLGIDQSEYPNLARWIERIEQREAVQRALKVPEGIMSKQELGQMFKTLRERMDTIACSDQQ